jgi:hypothetical protein
MKMKVEELEQQLEEAGEVVTAESDTELLAVLSGLVSEN